MSGRNIARMIHAEFKLAHILFRTDLQAAGSKDIRLGLLTELNVRDKCKFFGIAIRTSLTGDEVSLLPRLWVDRLNHPVVHFVPVFNAAWYETENSDDSAIDYLSESYNASLLVTPARSLALPVTMTEPDADIFEEANRIVIRTLDEEAENFLLVDDTMMRRQDKAA